jgi:hypothetical protein
MADKETSNALLSILNEECEAYPVPLWIAPGESRKHGIGFFVGARLPADGWSVWATLEMYLSREAKRHLSPYNFCFPMWFLKDFVDRHDLVRQSARRYFDAVAQEVAERRTYWESKVWC